MAFKELRGIVGRKIAGLVVAEDDELDATEMTIVFEDDAFLSMWWQGCYPAEVRGGGSSAGGRVFVCLGEFGLQGPPDEIEERLTDVYGEAVARVLLRSREEREGPSAAMDFVATAVGRRVRGIVMQFIRTDVTRVLLVFEDDRYVEFLSTAGEIDWLFEEHGGRDAAALTLDFPGRLLQYFDEPVATATIQ
jgi:hypothetical protein